MTFLLFVLLIKSGLEADLMWQSRLLSLTANVQQTNCVARFSFKNVGPRVVRIRDIKASCECTTATLTNRVYAGGDAGELVVNFAFGQRVGLQEKTIRVQTDDPENPTTLLKLRVDIPEIMRITPSFVSWGPGEAGKPKTMIVKITPGYNVRIKAIKSSYPTYMTELRTIQEGKEYAITVTPPDTTKPSWSKIEIETDFPKEKPRVFSAVALVR